MSKWYFKVLKKVVIMDKVINKNDIRVRNTQKALKDNLVILLQQKHLEKITVVELCECAGINRATFYKHYTDMYDLMEHVKEDLQQKIIEHMKIYYLQEGEAVEALVKFLRLVKVNAQLYLLLYSDNSPNSPKRQMWELTKDLYLKKHLARDSKLEFKNEMYLTFITGGNTSIIIDWLEKGAQVPEREIAEMILELVKINPVDKI